VSNVIKRDQFSIWALYLRSTTFHS